MFRKAVSGVMLILSLAGLVLLTFNIKPTRTQVVEAPITKPQIVNIEYPKEELDYDVPYNVTVTVKNEGDSGIAGVALFVGTVPLSVKGNGWYEFNAGEQKDITFTVRNIGLQEKTIECTIEAITSTYYDIYDRKSFTLKLGPSPLSVEPTTIIVHITNTKKENLNAIHIEIRGVDANFVVTGSTDTGGEGLSIKVLPEPYKYYTGNITVTATDPSGKYVEQTVWLIAKHGENTVEIVMSEQRENDFRKLIEQYLPYIISGIVAVAGLGLGVYLIRKRYSYGRTSDKGK